MFRDHKGHISSARVSLCNSFLFFCRFTLNFFATFVHMHPPAVTTQLQIDSLIPTSNPKIRFPNFI